VGEEVRRKRTWEKSREKSHNTDTHTDGAEEHDEMSPHGVGDNGGGRRKESGSGRYRGGVKAKGFDFRHLRDDCKEVFFDHGEH